MEIIKVETNDHNSVLRELFSEYLEWVLLKFEEEFKLKFNISLVEDGVNNSIEELHKFFPHQVAYFSAKMGMKLLVQRV